jgi:hypothetical protein
MGRRYTIPFDNVAVTQQQDLVTLYPNSGTFPKTFGKLLRVWVMCSDTTLPTAQQLRLRVARRQAIAPGGGGMAPAPMADDAGDPASQYLAHINDTTLATGTVDWQYEFGCYLYTGADLVFSDPPTMNGGDGFVFQLESTVSTLVHLSGGLLFEEFGSGV